MKNIETYIDFSEILELRKGLTIPPIDILPVKEIENKYHNNLKDPLLGVIIEKDVLVSKDFLAKTKDDYIIKDISYEKNLKNKQVWNICTRGGVEVDTFLLGGDTNYYHNLINWVPRLFLYESLNLSCKIVVNKNFSKIQHEVLKTIFPHLTDKIIKMESNLVLFRKLYIPNFFLNPIHSPYAIRNLRNRIFSLYRTGLMNKLFSENFIISRSKANTRKIVNEKEIFGELIKSHGFEIINLEALSFLEQVNLFFHAKKIISPHGAGLANLIFCNNFPKVIEIINDHYTKVFWSLGTLCGVSSYDIFKGIPVEQSHNIPIHKDIILDCKFLNDKRLYKFLD